MSAVPRPATAAVDRVALRVEDSTVAADVSSALQARGVAVSHGPADDDASSIPVAFAPATPLSLDIAAALEGAVREAALARQPFVILVPPCTDERRLEQSIALGYLRSCGAVLCSEPATWIEALVLVARIGLPLGPRVAVVAEPRSLLATQADALARERSIFGARIADDATAAAHAGHDAVLVGSRDSSRPHSKQIGGAIVVPVACLHDRLSADHPYLVDLRHAIAAVESAGDLALRLDAGLGPGLLDSPDWLEIDRERLRRQLGKLGGVVGDHETKVLLSCYGVPVTRQAVATTASAATRIAKKAGFPVDVKVWDPEAPSEADGCPIETGLSSVADVRRAFSAVAVSLNLAEGAPVIVRASPPQGRELRVQFRDYPEVGWMAVASVAGSGDVIAAPAPLSAVDATRLAGLALATRKNDRSVNRRSVADLLMRSSYLVWNDDASFESLDLGRIVVSTEGDDVVVADASCKRRR